MANTELPWLFMGRRVRPVAAGVGIATASIAFFLLGARSGPGIILDDGSPLAYFLGTFSLIACLLLFFGWLVNSRRLLEIGFMLSSGVFASRACFLFLDDEGSLQAVALSLSLLIISFGSWVLEITTGDREAPIVRKGRSE